MQAGWLSSKKLSWNRRIGKASGNYSLSLIGAENNTHTDPSSIYVTSSQVSPNPSIFVICILLKVILLIPCFCTKIVLDIMEV